MCTGNRFLAVAGSTLLSACLAAGDATAQSRRMSMSMSLPVSMQPMLPMQPLTTMQPLNPFMGLSYPFSNSLLQDAYMLNRYGYSTPYIPPVPSSGVNSRVNDIVVKLPIANAKILINGVETKGTGSSTRHVSVPDAPAGQKNEFIIKATWTIDGKTKSEERTVPLNGSGHQVVNFLVPQGR